METPAGFYIFRALDVQLIVIGCEVLDHLQVAYDEELISEELFKHGEALVWDAVKISNGYMSYLKKAGDPNTKPIND